MESCIFWVRLCMCALVCVCVRVCVCVAQCFLTVGPRRHRNRCRRRGGGGRHHNIPMRRGSRHFQGLTVGRHGNSGQGNGFRQGLRKGKGHHIVGSASRWFRWYQGSAKGLSAHGTFGFFLLGQPRNDAFRVKGVFALSAGGGPRDRVARFVGTQTNGAHSGQFPSFPILHGSGIIGFRHGLFRIDISVVVGFFVRAVVFAAGNRYFG
mmetsp:Transcript_23829/g.56178  ORF Transcript_23829/g.56178 Transcript_23829/m.56178 type:complete len:208 (-) Transcript_23829:958-1581(-)